MQYGSRFVFRASRAVEIQHLKLACDRSCCCAYCGTGDGPKVADTLMEPPQPVEQSSIGVSNNRNVQNSAMYGTHQALIRLMFCAKWRDPSDVGGVCCEPDQNMCCQETATHRAAAAGHGAGWCAARTTAATRRRSRSTCPHLGTCSGTKAERLTQVVFKRTCTVCFSI